MPRRPTQARTWLRNGWRLDSGGQPRLDGVMHKLARSLAVLAGTTFLLGATLTPDQKQSEDATVAATVKDLKDTCEATIQITIDWKSFDGVDLQGFSVSAFCLAPAKTL